MRKTDSHLDFDLELAKKQTSENPVYYIQYAHARIAGILAGSRSDKLNYKKIDFSLLKKPQERDLMRTILEFPYCLEMCANQLDPYNLTIYLQSLSAAFHRFYDLHKVLSEDESLTQARLFLILSVKIVLANGLGMMGVSAPERM
jgi:arginyl-tRNA synthetase